MNKLEIALDRRKFIKTAALAGAAASLFSFNARAEDGLPTRRKGKSVMGLTTPRLEKVRVGFVGLGMRGSGAISRYLALEGVELAALCDIRPAQVAAAQKKIAAKGLPAAKEFTGGPEDWKRMCELKDLDLIYNCTPWQLHTPISLFAMRAGKHAVTEVTAATSLAGPTISVRDGSNWRGSRVRNASAIKRR